MQHYVLLSGIHSDQHGVFYPGDIVTSNVNVNLESKWPERFIEWTDADERSDTPIEEEE